MDKKSLEFAQRLTGLSGDNDRARVFNLSVAIGKNSFQLAYPGVVSMNAIIVVLCMFNLLSTTN